MDSNNTIESSGPTFDSISHQTPFEKSLRRRVLKVKTVIALVDAEPEYTSVADLSSVDELRRGVEMYEALDIGLSNAVLRYIDVSLPAGFEANTYIGAFGTTDWTTGWTNFDPQNTEY